MAILEARALNKHFGGLHVTNNVDLTLEPGEIHCLIGPNGAGKSTLFRTYSASIPRAAGRSCSAARISRRSNPISASAAA